MANLYSVPDHQAVVFMDVMQEIHTEKGVAYNLPAPQMVENAQHRLNEVPRLVITTSGSRIIRAELVTIVAELTAAIIRIDRDGDERG